MADHPPHRPVSLAAALALWAGVAAATLLADTLLPPPAAAAAGLIAALAALLWTARAGVRATDERDVALERARQRARLDHRLHAMCSHCKSIRDPEGRWVRLEAYLEHHLQAEVTHGVCEVCLRVEYPGLFENLPEG